MAGQFLPGRNGREGDAGALRSSPRRTGDFFWINSLSCSLVYTDGWEDFARWPAAVWAGWSADGAGVQEVPNPPERARRRGSGLAARLREGPACSAGFI